MTGPFAFTGKVALITGGASGMGRSTAGILAAEGAMVALLDRDAAGLEKAVAAIGADKALALPADLARCETLDTAVAATLARFGRIDILLNVAGYRDQKDALDCVDPELWARTFAINCTGPARLIQKVGEAMIAQGEGGRIVNVSSSSGFRAMGNPPAAYSCAKAAIAQLTRVAAAALGPHDINVNTVVPGPTLTAMAARAGMSDKLAEIVKSGPMQNLLGRVSMPEDVAALIRFLCLPDSRQMTGQTLHVSAGNIV